METKIEIGHFVLDLDHGLLKENGKRIPIRPQTLSTLIYLAKNRSRVVSREELYGVLWPGKNVDEDQSLNVIIKNLRKVLNDNSKQPTFIETIPRRGYQFIGQPPQPIPKQPKPLSKKALGIGALAILAIMFSVFLVGEFTGQKPNSLILKKDLSVTAKNQLLLGEQKIREGKFEEGREVLEKVISAYPQFDEGHLWVARTWSWVPGLRGEGALKAKPHYQKALDLNPEYAEAMVEFGWLLLITDFNATKATELARKVLTLDPRNPRAFLLLGFGSLARGEPKTALEFFNQVSLIDPSLVNISARVGWTYFMAGEFEEAARLCEVLVQALVNISWARTCLFETYLAQEEFNLAKGQAIELMKEEGFTESEVKTILGEDTALWVKNYDIWQMEYLKAHELDTHYLQTFIYLRQGNRDAAFKSLQEAVRQRHFPYFLTINSDPRLKVLRDHPEADTVFLKFK